MNRIRLTPDYEPVTRQCLSCDKQFKSWDKKRNWICPKCSKSARYAPRFWHLSDDLRKSRKTNN